MEIRKWEVHEEGKLWKVKVNKEEHKASKLGGVYEYIKSVQARGFLRIFVMNLFFTVRNC
jgi:hypothetical protein